MKSVLINVRIPLLLKEHLDTDCENNNATISEVVRDIFQNHYEPEDSSINNLELPGHFVHSESFKTLFKWIIDKRVNPTDCSSKSILIDLKVTSLNIQENNQFPAYIQNEFNKVLHELSFAIKNDTGKESYFSFGLLHSNNPFNYSLVIDFILMKDLENNIYL